MNKAVPQKLCWNCEGSVPLQDPQCCYCGVSFNSSNSTMRESDGTNRMHSEFLQTLYPSAARKAKTNIEQTYAGNDEAETLKETSDSSSSHTVEDTPALPSKQNTSLLSPLLFLLTGSLLVFFGLMLSIFSQDGQLVLVWNSDYSILYLVLGFALTIWGVRNFRRMSND